MPPAAKAHDLKANRKDEWLDIPGVEAIGVDSQTGHIVINISDDNAKDHFPAEIDGVPIDFNFTGEISFELDTDVEAIDAKTQRTQVHRPIISGVSAGHGDIGSGTTGWVLEDPDTGTRYLASNNHVFAASNQASAGDGIYQPGAGYNGERVGHLKPYPELEDGQIVDLAWAECTEDIEPTIAAIDDPAEPVSVRQVETGEVVTKSGLTTGVTSAEVLQIDTAVNVRTGTGTYRFDQCIITDNMSDNGDSGSPVIDEDGNPVGMLFAGAQDFSVLCAADNIEEVSGMNIVYGPQEDEEPDEEPVPRAGVELAMTPLEEDGNEDEGGNPDPERGRLAVRLVDTDSGEPISGGEVTVTDADGDATSTTDREGTTFFTVSLAGEVDVVASAEGYEDAETTLTGDDFEVEQ